MTWTVAAPAISAAFLSSLVEAVEALTIVLAVGTVRGWRPAGLGAVAGLALLALIVLALGPLAPEDAVRTGILLGNTVPRLRSEAQAHLQPDYFLSGASALSANWTVFRQLAGTTANLVQTGRGSRCGNV